VDAEQLVDDSPWALQLAARVEKTDPPTIAAICAAAALATIELLDDPRSHPDGEWHEAVAQWNGARIRKIVRRGRASAWQRAQVPDGVTVERDGAEVRAFVPSPMDQAPEALAKLQIQSSPLDEVEPVDSVLDVRGLLIAVTPHVEMSWGKQAAQCAHAGQWAWMRSSPDVVAEWDAAGRPITVIHPTPALWARLVEEAPVQIHDGGFTEIPAGTKTTLAWWGDLDERQPSGRRNDATLAPMSPTA
jgi:peptidyl-tRNA hydrolase